MGKLRVFCDVAYAATAAVVLYTLFRKTGFDGSIRCPSCDRDVRPVETATTAPNELACPACSYPFPYAVFETTDDSAYDDSTDTGE